jgi:hypothetical protein
MLYLYVPRLRGKGLDRLLNSNVDRMFAIFKALHPDIYVEGETTQDETFTEPPGYTETVTSDLSPF